MTKVVQLSDAAYERLKAQKQPGESFSDVVLRAIGRPSLLKAMARLPKRSDAELEAHLGMMREARLLDEQRWERLENFRRTGKWQ